MKIAFFDAKPFDKVWFEKFKGNYEFIYFESKLTRDTALLAKNCKGVVAFVNDTIDKQTIDMLHELGVEIIAMRCAGYNNIDFTAAFKKIHITNVPAYSPYCVAEYAMALLLTLNRKVHRAYNRTREHNFNIDGLTGFELKNKTIGIIGTGKIGRIFIDICNGFGMNVLAYDPYPIKDSNLNYVSFEELCKNSNIISLHCPLTKETKHLLNKDSFSIMQEGVIIINTSRGALIDSSCLLENVKSHKVKGAALDVYEEETELFFEDFSGTIIDDDILSMLITMPNVIVTSHQAFLTDEALSNIAQTTIQNLDEYFSNANLTHEICYHCSEKGCDKSHIKRCF